MSDIRECEQCGAACDYSHNPKESEPCWGQVRVIDELQCGTEEEPDWTWVHACEGHADMHDGGKYKPKDSK